MSTLTTRPPPCVLSFSDSSVVMMSKPSFWNSALLMSGSMLAWSQVSAVVMLQSCASSCTSSTHNPNGEKQQRQNHAQTIHDCILISQSVPRHAASGKGRGNSPEKNCIEPACSSSFLGWLESWSLGSYFPNCLLF